MRFAHAAVDALIDEEVIGEKYAEKEEECGERQLDQVAILQRSDDVQETERLGLMHESRLYRDESESQQSEVEECCGPYGLSESDSVHQGGY